MINRKRKIYSSFLLVLFVIGLLFTHFYLPRFITEIRNPLVLLVKGKNQLHLSSGFQGTGLEGKTISFNSFDGVELSAYLTYSGTDSTKGTIILLHGIRSSKECFKGLSKRLSKGRVQLSGT